MKLLVILANGLVYALDYGTRRYERAGFGPVYTRTVEGATASSDPAGDVVSDPNEVVAGFPLHLIDDHGRSIRTDVVRMSLVVAFGAEGPDTAAFLH